MQEKAGTDIITVEHLSHVFGDKPVLQDVNLSIGKGEFMTILGPSGCGKTTLIRLIGGFLKASEGKITIAGEDMTMTPPHLRPVNTVFQRYALFPHLNVYNNIAFGLKLKKLPEEEIKKKVKQVLKIVTMTDYEERDVDTLSGGQQQRVAIARAIVNEPEVLLLDEPLAALDLKMRKDMQMEIKAMHKKLGITFLYVTHDQEEALTLSDTIVVMREGLIQQIGTPAQIYNEPENSFVADFIGESNILNGVMIKDYLVEFAGHRFECVDKGFRANELVDVVIRPEDIYIFEKLDAAQFSGLVTSCIFKGVHYEMMVATSEGYEILIQDYNGFEAGETVGLRVKPSDIQVMKKERLCNTFEGTIEDESHVHFLGNTFECGSTGGLENGSEVKIKINFNEVILHDNEEDGILRGTVTFILYKGDHYHLTVLTEENENIFLDTNDIWDDGDRVGISISPESIQIENE
jgi:spermidine/putrescine transport system ATP-binding protein